MEKRTLKWLKPYTADDWIYRNDTPDNSGVGNARFVLGVKGDKPLVCFGINPSTANHETPDATMQRVESYAYKHDYDSFIMLNVYPQRATDPKNIDTVMNYELHKRNLLEIEKVLSRQKLTLWAAWGANIKKRSFLQSCLDNINEIVTAKGYKWYCLDTPNFKYPHHPLYISADTKLVEYTGLKQPAYN
jgi:hypothetical protein